MKTNAKLWTKLSRYDIGYAEAALSFTDRLARDNNWSASFAARAVVEYKKFVYLAMTGDGPVTPSDEVDQVWHLHLVYTHDYWGEFTQLLGAPLHHGPTPGGDKAMVGYQSFYAQTKARYEEEFGEPPAADLWPDAESRFSNPMHFHRVDLRRYKARRAGIGMWVAVAGILVAGGAGISATAHDGIGLDNGVLEWIKHAVVEHNALFFIAFLVFGALCIYINKKINAVTHGGGKKKNGRNGGCSGWGNGCSGCSGCSGCGGCGA